MRIQVQLLALNFILLVNAQNSLGQAQSQTPPLTPVGSAPSNSRQTGYDLSREAKAESESRMREAEMRRRALNNRKSGAALPIVLTEDELTSEERKALAPTPEDLKANADFLRQSGTGIFRLMRVDKQTHRKVVNADSLKVTGDVLLVGGGAHYSFTKKNHNADKWSDLGWDEDWFLAGVGGEAVGVLIELGNIPLESVGLDNKGVVYLAKLTPMTTEAAAEQQFHQFEKGVTEDGMTFGLSALWKLDTTYALRSINYGRSDVLVAFRAIRQDANGSLIILWKKLKTYSTPNLRKERK
ncbi:MAG: hypothetical protein JST85_06865 [Acidobacteria bacterium]|nr:hypothetical protein [Acidobacteriota bacterium]